MPSFNRDQTRIHINLFSEEYRAIKRFARQHHLTMSSVIRMLIKQLIDNQAEIDAQQNEIIIINEKVHPINQEPNHLIF